MLQRWQGAPRNTAKQVRSGRHSALPSRDGRSLWRARPTAWAEPGLQSREGSTSAAPSRLQGSTAPDSSPTRPEQSSFHSPPEPPSRPHPSSHGLPPCPIQYGAYTTGAIPVVGRGGRILNLVGHRYQPIRMPARPPAVLGVRPGGRDRLSVPGGNNCPLLCS